MNATFCRPPGSAGRLRRRWTCPPDAAFISAVCVLHPACLLPRVDPSPRCGPNCPPRIISLLGSGLTAGIRQDGGAGEPVGALRVTGTARDCAEPTRDMVIIHICRNRRPPPTSPSAASQRRLHREHVRARDPGLRGGQQRQRDGGGARGADALHPHTQTTAVRTSGCRSRPPPRRPGPVPCSEPVSRWYRRPTPKEG